MPPINPHITPCHKATRITEQKHRRTTVLARTGQTAEHVILGPGLATLGILDEELLHHGGDDVAGRNGVAADLVGAPFHGEVAGELEDAGFAGVVGGADEALSSLAS